MRALILADIHANLEALTAVMEDARGKGGFDAIWCLGDTVGYGPDPNACLEMIRGYPLTVVAGNHDFAVVGKRTTDDFNYAAKASAEWTRNQLSKEAGRFLGDLPLSAIVEPFTLVHGSLRDPLSEYLLDEETASATLEILETRYCLVGHSHLPFICSEIAGDTGGPEFLEFTEDQPFPLSEGRSIFNPGGVGQPRDRDPRSSYAVYDSQERAIWRHRVAYQIALSAIVEPFTLVHGSLRDPLSEYLLDEETASATLEILETRYCLVGHSHLPFICSEIAGDTGGPEFLEFTEDQPFPLSEGRSIFNPGGVGQPRDRDPRSSYAVYDSQERAIWRHRVAYQIGVTQEKMRHAKLPEYLIERLNDGR